MLADRVAIVTGAGRGIGRGVALALAAAGAKVVVNDFGVELDGSTPSAGPAVDVAKEIAAEGGEAVANAESVADFESARRIVDTAIERFGRIDILVTCAGIVRDRMVFNMSEEEWDAVLAVHLKGTFNCVRHACTLMREQRYGRIKGGISGLTKVAARDLGRYGVTVNAICPVAGTRMTVTDAYLKSREIRKQQGIVREDRGTESIEQLDPNDVAPMVAYLASEHAGNVNGQFFLCYGSAVALLSQPRPVKTLFKSTGIWTLDELDRLAPTTVLEGLKNPAPAKEA
jgi:NAD(P)-dependent dehydrogenase (short-subunit alcohol dehydrogenase family)